MKRGRFAGNTIVGGAGVRTEGVIGDGVGGVNRAVVRVADQREDGYSDGRAGEGAELLGRPWRLSLKVTIRKRPVQTSAFGDLDSPFLLFFFGEVLHVYHFPYYWTL